MTYCILSIETATEYGSIALSFGETVLSRSLGEVPQTHSRSILPAIHSLLAEAGLSLKNLDAIAIGKGPGSFTGVRLGLSVAQGLCFGLEIPCIPISTLAILAYGAKPEAKQEGIYRIMAAMDARMQEVYVGLYELKNNNINNLVPDFVQKPDKIDSNLFNPYFGTDNRIIAIGTGWQVAYQADLLKSTLTHPVVILPKARPQAHDLSQLAIMAMKEGKYCAPEACFPAYCRDKVV